MFDFRYHALSLVAVFLALGIGIVLGVTIGDSLVSDAEKNIRASLRGDVVDAKGVSRLYRPSAGRGPILLLTFAAFVTFVIVVATSSSLKPLLDLLWLKLQILLGLQ